MFARKGVFSSIGRTAAMVSVAALALTAVEPSLALAGSAPAGKGFNAASGTSGATDISARRRHFPAAAVPRGRGLCRHRRHRHCDRRGPEPAGLL